MEHGAAVPTAAAGAPPVAGPNTNANANVNNKEKEREKEKDRERERELELEAALYSNCLLLGIDQTVFHTNTNGGPRIGLFRHSNPRLGEALLHFLLCALRGPAQSSKDFAGVWPIFDSAQSRDFRKIVQGIINELESQGALPRSNSRVSLLATCCGHRFVELLWQLSAHALREVHKRTFAADVASNPLPASLTDMVNQSSHASALLTVTKAKIALERRRFLENASTAVQRQAMWSSLAHDMTAEYRALCAEEAYLQQELEKLQISRNCKVDIEDELDQHSCLDSAMDQKNLSVARATHLWESLMTHTDQHEELASGPIEDLIAHREHRYRISGSALRAAMDHGSDVSPDEESLQHIGSFQDSGWDNQEKSVKPLENQGSDDMYTKAEERTGKPLSVDVAEILRRWTHALQRIHKQAVKLARTNDGGGTHLFKKAPDVGVNGHSEALQATLAEHTNHLNNIKALVNQLKDSMPGMEATITKLREEVDQTPLLPDVRLEDKAVLDSDAKCQDIDEESNADTPVEEDSKEAHLQLELIPPTPALKLPQLFSVSPFPGEKDVFPRNQSSRTRLQLSDAIQDFTVSSTSPPANQSKVEDMEDKKNSEISSLKKDVRNAALFKLDYYTPVEKESFGNDNGHFFMPLSSISGLLKADTNDQPTVRKPNQQISLPDNNFYDVSWEPHLQTLNESNENQQNNGSLTGSLAQPLSPTLLSEFSSFDESYDDLLAPMSEVDAAMMYSSNQVLHT